MLVPKRILLLVLGLCAFTLPYLVYVHFGLRLNGGVDNGKSLAALRKDEPSWKTRAAQKNGKDPMKCSCHLAKKSTMFSEQLSRAMADLDSCRRGTEQLNKEDNECALDMHKSDIVVRTRSREGKMEPLRLSEYTGDRAVVVGFAGKPFEVEITPRNSNGGLCTNGANFLYVSVSRKHENGDIELHAVPCASQKSGKNRFVCTGVVYEAAMYTLSIQSDSEHGFEVPLYFRPIDFGVKAKEKTKNRECDSSERISQIFRRGHWVGNKWVMGDSFCEIPRLNLYRPDNRRERKGKEMAEKILSERSRVRMRVMKAIGGKHIMFVGDSLLRCIYWSTLVFLNHGRGLPIFYNSDGKTKRGDSHHSGGHGCFYTEVAPSCAAQDGDLETFEDQTRPCSNVKPESEHDFSVDGNNRVRMTWRCGWDSTFAVDFPGLSSQKTGYYNGDKVARIFGHNFLIDHSNPAHPSKYTFEYSRAKNLDGNIPDALVLSVATHDMISNDISAFRFNLNWAFHTVRVDWGFKGPIVWITASTAVSWIIERVYKHYKHHTFPMKTSAYNRVAEEIAASWGAVVLDAETLTYGRSDLTSDGQHYVRSNKGCELHKTQCDPVYMSATSALLHELARALSLDG